MTSGRAPAGAGGPAAAAPAGGHEEWAVSPFNTEGLAGAGAFAAPPRISDCTLRDGEQQAGLVFSRRSKVAIAAMLDEIGVHDLEVGTPAVSDDDRAAIEEIAAAGLRATVSALARATEADVGLVASTGADAVRISFPISSRQRAAKLGVSDREYVGESLRISHYAKSLGLQVVFSPYDTTRADLPLLERLLQAFREERCVDRVRLVDTVGAASPEGIRFLVRFMRQAAGDIPLEVHCHNDFGLGTANTIAAALAGADYLSLTVNGLGERAGNTPLEEVVVALKILYGIDTGVATERLKPLSDEVARLSGIGLQAHKAIVGANCFRHETGTVVAGLMRDPFTAEPYAPEVVGQHRQVVLGKLSGAASVRYKLAELGLGDAGTDVTAILTAVKAQSIALERSLGDDEVRRIADDIIGSRARPWQ